MGHYYAEMMCDKCGKLLCVCPLEKPKNHKKIKKKNKQYWMCIIGGANPDEYKGNGADLPLRMAVRNKFNEIFGEDEVCASGWGIDEERYNLLRQLHSKDTLTLKKLLKQK